MVICRAYRYLQRPVFIASFIFVAIFYSGILFSTASTKDLEKEAVASAGKGGQWLYRYQGKFIDPAIAYIIRTINEDYCGPSEKLENFWRNILKEFKEWPYLPLYGRLFDNSSKYKLSDKAMEILKTSPDFNPTVLLQSLNCDLYPAREDFVTDAFNNTENEGRYSLTHMFWSAYLFKNNGCSLKECDLDKVILTAAEKIAEEQKTSKNIFDDLYAERAAFLLYFGFENMVKDKWIKNIIGNQRQSGAWATPSYSGKNFGNPHTTALAVWALSLYSKSCPF